ncbi:MAG: S8 family peptidase, partial [Acidimicrobiia bacterium]
MTKRAVTRGLSLLLSAGALLGTGGLPVARASASAPAAPAGGNPAQVLVKYRPGTADAEIEHFERRAGAAHVADVYRLGVRVLRAANPEGTGRLLDATRRNPAVAYAELDGSGALSGLIPNDPYWSSQWGSVKVNAPAAWASTTGSETVVIATLDTGAALAHPDLSGAFVPGWDFVNNDSDPSDDHGHGTSVAGIAAARTNNGTGMAGTCWNCRIMPVKVATATGSVSWSTLASGITWAADHGAQVISMSITGASSTTTLADAVTYAHNHNVVLVAAAGNTGNTALGYPAALPGVISVGGSDQNDARYSFSAYGDWVDVAAPGCNQATTMAGGYRSSFCGTSAATPVVAGIAALAISARPGVANTAVEDGIRSSAIPVGSWVHYGRVDAAATLSTILSGTSTSTTSSTTTTTTT